MTDFEWVNAILKVDGNALRKWLETHAPKTGATPAQIARIVGNTGPKPKYNVEAIAGIAAGKF